MDRTLLLNCSYEPVAAISWKRAICLLMLGKVETVEEYDRQVRSAKEVFKVPAVVRLIEAFRRHRKRVKFSKQNVFARDRYKCQYCGVSGNSDSLTMDHVISRSKGGLTEFTNVVTCCKECNLKKADKTLKECGMKLLSTPYIPDWLPLIFQVSQVPDVWDKYVFFKKTLDK